MEKEISIQGVNLAELAKTFGTPLFVYDADKIAQQILTLKKVFNHPLLRIKYAAKASSNVNLLNWVRLQDVDVDVVSLEEGAIARKAGFAAHQIMFTPSCVDFSEIRKGVEMGFQINLDDLGMLEQFGETFGDKVPVCLRINPDILAGGNLKISTGHKFSKFGIPSEYMHRAKGLVQKYNITINGLHLHTGSDITEPEVFLEMARVLFSHAQEFKDLRFLDIGSGFKVAYHPDDHTTPMEILGPKVVAAFSSFCEKYGRDLELWIEPGKFIVSEAGVLLASVNTVKKNPHRTFAGLNTGLNHLVRPMMYNAYHEIVNVSNPNAEKETYTVVGYICETDTFAEDRAISTLRPGDIVMIKNTGAYGFTMSSNYNSRVRPAEVLIHKGIPKLIRRSETVEDLLRNQVIVDL